MARPIRETDLSAPLKAWLQRQGFEVKGEVGAADLVGVRGDDLVIVEIKTGFSLALFHQGIDRLAVTDHVFLAVPAGGRTKALRRNVQLARRAGLGVLTVRPRDGFVEVLAEPGPYAARRSPKKAARMRRAFDRLEGDPNAGGAVRQGLVTGYRQDAVTCARHIAEHGPSRGAEVKAATGVSAATQVMAGNPYGWFLRVARGVYDLTDAGRQGLIDWGDL